MVPPGYLRQGVRIENKLEEMIYIPTCRTCFDRSGRFNMTVNGAMILIDASIRVLENE